MTVVMPDAVSASTADAQVCVVLLGAGDPVEVRPGDLLGRGLLQEAGGASLGVPGDAPAGRVGRRVGDAELLQRR